MPKLIPLRNRKKEVVAHAIVDDEDFEWAMQWRWHSACGTKGYVARNGVLPSGRRGLLYLHIAIAKKFLAIRDGDVVDHGDLNRLNATRRNLSVLSEAQNMRNTPIRRSNTSGFKGVTWNRQNKKWDARVVSNYKTTRVGLFKTAEEAARAYDGYQRNMPDAHICRYNFPRPGERSAREPSVSGLLCAGIRGTVAA